MRQTIIAFFSALLFLVFTPANAEAKDSHKKHKRDRHHWSHHGRDRNHYGNRGHHYGRQRVSYRPGHYTWVRHHRVWVPPARVVVYY